MAVALRCVLIRISINRPLRDGIVMNRISICLLALCLIGAAPPEPGPPNWSIEQSRVLNAWLTKAKDEGLAIPAGVTASLNAAMAEGVGERLDDAATEAAVVMLESHRNGCCNAALRTGWHIADDPAWPDALTSVRSAVERDRIGDLFNAAQPSHPFYLALRDAYRTERNPAHRATIAANLDRWRWMPRRLGRRYLLVNTAAYEATYWEDGAMKGRWRVVVGKTSSPTPSFAATVTGVILNPWWEIPPSIARESIAALLRNHPKEAARKGYVQQGSRYRQRPGSANALGHMKLVMPNAYNVYLHDTPSRDLFTLDARAFSHGCVRVGDALGLVASLLGDVPDWTRERIDAAVASGETRSIDLSSPVRVYIAYFTAEPDEAAGIRYFDDVYRRDLGARAPAADGQCPR